MRGRFVACKQKIKGDTSINPEVFATIARKAVDQCYGVVGVSLPSGLTLTTTIFPFLLKGKGVYVKVTETGLVFDIYVILEYGVNISVVCKNLTDQVRFLISKFTKTNIDSVNIYVKGIRRMK